MSQWIHIDFLDAQRLLYVFFDIVIAVGLITAMRFFSGWVSHVRSIPELAVKDNFAFGLSLAGGILALAIMLTGIVAENVAQTLGEQVRVTLGYGILGVALIKLGRSIQDRWFLRGLSIQAEIIRGNLAAAVVDVANALVTAMVVRSVVVWVDIQGLSGLISVVATCLGAQLVIGAMTLFWMHVFHRRHPKHFFTQALENRQVALATRYACHTIGAAFALSAGSGVVRFYSEGVLAQMVSLVAWLVCGSILCLTISVLARLSRRVILSGVNIAQEIADEDNLAVAVVEGALYLGIGFYFLALFG